VLKIVRVDGDNYPKTFQDSIGEIYLVTKDHCGYLRIIQLIQGGHIWSAEYTTIDEIIKQHEDWIEIETKLTVEKIIKSI
jgi:hypothetical protein